MTAGPRLTGCETVSVTDSLRPPDRFAPSIESQSDLSTHQERENSHLPDLLLSVYFCSVFNVNELQSNLENSFLSAYKHKYLV